MNEPKSSEPKTVLDDILTLQNCIDMENLPKKSFKAGSLSEFLSSSGYVSSALAHDVDSFGVSGLNFMPSNLFCSTVENNTWGRYAKLLPRAKRQMESKLCEFIDMYNKDFFHKHAASPCEKFAAEQIVKIARSLCIQSLSVSLSLTREYFCGINIKIENLILETANKNPDDLTILYDIARRFDLITSETIRILTCIELNTSLNDPGLVVPDLKNTDQDLKSYLFTKLGEKDSAVESTQTDSQLIIHKGKKLFSISLKQPANEALKNINPASSIDSSISEFLLPKESDFTIVKLISQGAFSAVYLVRHKDTHRRYAMKKIHKNHAFLKNQVRQIFAERDILSFTDNPFVVSMFCSFETKNSYCMLMEYAEGGDCSSLLKSVGILSIEMSRVYIAETIVAVEYIHNYGIIHRDIKPDNLLITSLGHIKLTDFGLSKIGLMNMATVKSKEYFESFQDTKIQGTPDYIAPEVIINKPYGRAVDYWSIGIVMYEFLVGCTPFYGNNVEELFEAIVSMPLEWPEGEAAVSKDSKDIISKLLDKDPINRICSEGVDAVKSHPFFNEIKWNDLLQTKAQFIPTFRNEEDTSLFNDRSDRYHHDEMLNRDELAPTSAGELSSFTSYTKLFKNQMHDSTSKSCSTTSQITNDSSESSVFSDTPSPASRESTQSMSVSQINASTPKKIVERSVSQDSEVKTITHQKQINLNTITKNIEIMRDLGTNNFGFAIKTVRVTCNKNISFFNHIIESVCKDSPAHLAGLVPGQIILYIDGNLIVGKQHVEVIKFLSISRSIKISVCFMEQVGMRIKYKPLSVYVLDSNSLFLKFLINANIRFEKIVGYYYIPVMLKKNGKVIENAIDSPSSNIYLKKSKNNIFKKFIKKVILQNLYKIVDKKFDFVKSNLHNTLPICNLSQDATTHSQKKLSGCSDSIGLYIHPSLRRNLNLSKDTNLSNIKPSSDH
ncbi:hypothetical protein HZS_6335, partial [Henneguya salminicola]